jgi:hypothetical protein
MSQQQRSTAQQQKQKLLALINNAQMAIGAIESFCCYTNNARYMGEACNENVECRTQVEQQLDAMGKAVYELEQFFSDKAHVHVVG